jgi:hypothetical protein
LLGVVAGERQVSGQDLRKIQGNGAPGKVYKVDETVQRPQIAVQSPTTTHGSKAPPLAAGVPFAAMKAPSPFLQGFRRRFWR